jgi:hypothetical protein
MAKVSSPDRCSDGVRPSAYCGSLGSERNLPCERTNRLFAGYIEGMQDMTIRALGYLGERHLVTPHDPA